MTGGRTCLVCGAGEWVALPDPGLASMASDWRVLPVPLGKISCRRCGLVARRVEERGARRYADGYALYDHAPGAGFEGARQEQYAAWIAEAVAGHTRRTPQRILDVGCGNGSLLVALASAWPDAELRGCDPSPEAIAHAGPRVRLWQGTSATLAAGIADLVVAVNVIEHTADPVAFLTDLRRACAPAGTLIVVCPDGSRPGVELLFADHLHSFSAPHLRAFAARAGLMAVTTLVAPAALGEFQMLVAAAVTPGLARIAVESPGALNRRRAALLQRWAELDQRLEPRVAAGTVCFGVGEAAGLLRAYAPRTWTRVRACTADRRALNPAAPSFGGLPIVPLEALPPETPILVGVRPGDQAAVGERLARQFASVATWYDLVDASADC